jgi:ribonuclease-3 family protein
LTEEKMDFADAKRSNTTTLAFLGDAVYEVFIRRHVMENARPNAHAMNRMAIRYVSAGGQALAVREMLREDFLSDEEVRLVKRARNHTNTARPRGATPAEYKLATGLEALIGGLYLSGERSRLREVVREAIRVIDESADGRKKK